MNILRNALVVALAALAGCGTQPCRPGTLLLKVDVSSQGAHVDSLQVDVSVSGQGERASTINLSGRTSGTLEVDFPNYPQGAKVTIAITALSGTTVVGMGSGSSTLTASCETLSISIPPLPSNTNGDMALPIGDMNGTVSDAGPISMYDGGQQDGSVPLPPDAGVGLAFSSLSLAGGQIGGVGSADGTGPDARLNAWGVVMTYDAAENSVLYIADKNNHVLRRLNLNTGVLSTVAGQSGTPGTADGIGPDARFHSLSGVTIGNNNSVLVADTGNHAIRKYDPVSGAVTTVAGTIGLAGSADGSVTTAQFRSPAGIDADGNGVIVADTGNNTIRKVDFTANTVTTIAGMAGTVGSSDGSGAAARFNSPIAICNSTFYGIYVSDYNNGTVRLIDEGTKAVTTAAGSAGNFGDANGEGNTVRFSNPQGLAMGSTATGAGIVIADSGNDNIRTIDGDNLSATLAGSEDPVDQDGVGTAASFLAPTGVATNNQTPYTYWTVDSAAGTIRQIVDSTKTVTTVAGTPPHPGSVDGASANGLFTSPWYVVADDQNIYVSATDAVRTINRSTGAVATPYGTNGVAGSANGSGQGASFNGARGLALDGAGHLFVADSNNDTVRQIVLSTGAVTTLAGTAGMAGTTDGTGVNARFRSPSELTYDGHGHLYASDSYGTVIRKIDIGTGDVSTLAPIDNKGSLAIFTQIGGLTSDDSGSRLYFTDAQKDILWQLDLTSNTAIVVAGTSGTPGSTDGVGSAALFKAPGGAVFVSPNFVYLCDSGNDTVREVNLISGQVHTVAGVVGRAGVKLGALPGSLNGGCGINVTPDRRLVLGQAAENSVLYLQ